MNQDMVAAFACQRGEGAVAFWELEFQCWDKASGRHMVLGHEYSDLSREEQERALRTNSEIFVGVAEEYGFSAITAPNLYWEVAPGAPAFYWLPPEGRYEQIRQLRQMAEDDLMLVGISGGVYGMPPANFYQEFMMKLYDAPEEIEELTGNALRNGIENAKCLRDAGVDAVLTASDIADNRGPIYSLELMERFVFPRLHEWVQNVKDMGLYAIIHTDGNLYSCLEHIIESGVDALQAIDPVAGMDLKKTKELAGDRICLCGNVDSGLLQTGPEDEIYRRTQEVVKLAESRGGIVLGASNAVFHETPIEHYKALVRGYQEMKR